MTSNHEDALAQATELLRQHTDAGWTAIGADVLNRALRAFRPSEPVRGRHDLGDFFIASDVVVARLREAVDEIPGTAATRITCTTDSHQQLDSVTLEVAAAYGTHLLTLAGQIHRTAADRLIRELGELAPTAEAIRTHVHINDVTDDPRDVL